MEVKPKRWDTREDGLVFWGKGCWYTLEVCEAKHQAMLEDARRRNREDAEVRKASRKKWRDKKQRVPRKEIKGVADG